MVFSSITFLCLFMPVTLILYYLLPAKFRNLFLFVASLVFYAWGEPVYVLIMIFSTVFDYCNGLMLEKFDRKGNDKARKAVLALSVIINIGLMGFFKYTDFAIESVNTITGAGLKLLHIALPIGISFYTFQTLSYTIDVYRKQVAVQHNIIDFGMYISMFPQLIAGPIVRYADIETQIKGRKLEIDKVFEGIFRFAIGLGKKVLIANQMGALFDEIILSKGVTPALTAWTGALAFAFQIYFDFSGYSDMAIGLGRMLGFDIPENFDHPYESGSVTEFWRRWHMTLGTWFREYVYIPLGGNRKGLPRQILNLFVVWFLTGLWHGAGVNFIMWGLYFFVFLVIEKLFLLKVLKKIPKFFGHIYTLLAVLFSWIIFSCDKTPVLWQYIKSAFGANGGFDSMSFYYLRTYGIMFIVSAFLSLSLMQKLGKKIADSKKISPVLINIFKILFICAILVLCLIFISGDSYNPFLYFRF